METICGPVTPKGVFKSLSDTEESDPVTHPHKLSKGRYVCEWGKRGHLVSDPSRPLTSYVRSFDRTVTHRTQISTTKERVVTDVDRGEVVFLNCDLFGV